MATPNWDVLHLRFASAARDAVATAGTDGQDLTVSDRDSYLNMAYSKYILLLLGVYKDDPELLRTALQTMVKHVQMTSVSAAISAIRTSAPDYGLLLSIFSTNGKRTVILTPEKFYAVKNNISNEIREDGNTFFALPADNSISLIEDADIPDSFGYSGYVYDLVYIAYPVTITEGGSTDISIGSIHYDPIVDFALYYYYINKQDFDTAKSFYSDAFMVAPFPLVKK